jgi:hypothetical protein
MHLRKFSDDDRTYAVYRAGLAMGRLVWLIHPKLRNRQLAGPRLGAGWGIALVGGLSMCVSRVSMKSPCRGQNGSDTEQVSAAVVN